MRGLILYSTGAWQLVVLFSLLLLAVTGIHVRQSLRRHSWG